jgi:acyl-CoA reductase-like NAD-dependent aldehyde dehydrogenase
VFQITIEPTVFSNVDNKQTIAQEEIFGPVLSVIPADNEQHAVDIANDTIYGLNAAVFTPDTARAREIAGQLRSGTVGHNNSRLAMRVAFGGFKTIGHRPRGRPRRLTALSRNQNRPTRTKQSRDRRNAATMASQARYEGTCVPRRLTSAPVVYM